MDTRVLDAIARLVLMPEAIDYVIERALALVEARLRERPEVLPRLQAEARKVQREINHLVTAIADGESPPSVMAEIRKREHRLHDLERQIGSYAAAPPDESARARYRKRAMEGIGQLKDLLYSDVGRARQALRKLFRDRDGTLAPLRFYPTEHNGAKTFDFKGNLAAGAVLYNVSAEERT